MIRYFAFLLIFGIGTSSSFGQTFSKVFFINDSEDNSALVGATVSVIDTLNQETLASGVTNAIGFVTLGWTIVSNEDRPEIPNEMQVSNVFPNPVISRATVDFTVGKNEQINVEIFDLLGRRVGSYDQSLNAGGYKLLFQVNGLAKGVYFARISYGDQVEIRKFSYIGDGQGGLTFTGLTRSGFSNIGKEVATSNSEGLVIRVEYDGYQQVEAPLDFESSGVQSIPMNRLAILTGDFDSETTNFVPGDIQIINVDGPGLPENGVYNGFLADDTPVTLRTNPANTNQVVFAVPVATAGDQTITFNVDQQTVSLPFVIDEYEQAEDPTAYVNEVLDSLTTRYDSIIEELEEGSFKDQVATTLQNLSQVQTTLGTLSTGELELLSRIIPRFVIDGERDFNRKVFITNQNTAECVSPEDIINGDLNYVLGYQSQISLSPEITELGWGTNIATVMNDIGLSLQIMLIEDAKNKMEYFFSACLALDQSPGSMGIADEDFNLYSFDNRFRIRENVTYTYYLANRYNTPYTLLQKLNQLDSFLEGEGVLLPESWKEILFPGNGFVFVTRDLEHVIIEENNFQFDVDIVKGDSSFTVTFDHTHDFFKFDSEQTVSFSVRDTLTGRFTSATSYIKPGLTAKFRNDSSAFIPGEVQPIDISGIISEIDTLDAFYAIELEQGINASIFISDIDTTLLFGVPEIETGQHILSFEINGQPISLDYEIGTYEPITNPEEYITTSMSDIRTTFESVLVGSTDSEEIEFINSVLSNISSLENQLSQFSESDLAIIARFFKTNSVVDTNNLILSVIQTNRTKTFLNGCDEIAARIKKETLRMVFGTVGVAGILGGGGYLLLVGTNPYAWGALILGGALFYKTRTTVINSLGELIDCFSPDGQEITGDVQKSNPVRSKSLNEDTIYDLEHIEELNLRIITKYIAPESVRSVFKELQKAIDNSSVKFPKSWFSFLDRTVEFRTESPNNIYIKTSDPKIEGTATISDTLITVSFAYTDSTSRLNDIQARSFSFTLSDSSDVFETETINVSAEATLEYPLPIAEDQSIFIADKGERIEAFLNSYFSTTLNLTSDVEHGTLDIVSSYGGRFFYTPNDDFTGVDQFKYTLTNYRGESDTATVTISVADSIGFYENAVLGEWTVYGKDDNTGEWDYSAPRYYTVLPNGVSEYRSGEFVGTYTWEIRKENGKYFFWDGGFWHPVYREQRRLVDRPESSLTIPVTRFITYLESYSTAEIYEALLYVKN